MKQAKNTKKALLSSVLSLVLCLTMLIGTTFAWFTDSVTSANNIIKSGNLKVSLEYMDGTKEVADVESNEWKDASQEAIFDYSLWEPGYVSVRHIKIGNEGSLALKYMVAIEANGEVSELADVIDVYYVDPAQKIADRTALTEANKLGTLTDVLGKLDSTAAGNLAAGSADRITIALKMQETAGNEYQNLSIGTDFSVKVFATQLAAENDSFGPDYDEDAYLPVVRSLAQLRNAIADGQSVRLGSDISVEEADAENGNAIYYTGDESITIDLNGHTFIGNTSNVVFRFQKAAGGAENTITIKNGKIVADEDSWSAVSVGSSASAKTYVKLENLEISSCKANDMAVRARSGANITMSDCIVNANAYGGGVVAGGGEVTMNNVTIKQSGLDASAPWNSAAFGISGGGKMIINSGSYYAAPKSAADGNNQGTSHGSFTGIIMNSGGTLIINGGTFTNDNYGENSLATAARGVIEADTGAVVEINGGEFNGLKSILAMTNNLGDASRNPSATLKGGTFSADPRVSGLYASHLIKVADGHVAIDNGDGTWTVSRDYIAVPTVSTDKKANGAALADVMNSATEASYLKLGAGEYSMPSIGGSKDITIVGSKDTVIDVTMGAYLDGSKVTFEGVTIKGSTGMANGNGSDYAAMYTPNVTYINCTFDGAFRVGRDGATFINCTFNNLGDNYIWNMNNDTVFEGCTFNSDGKALLLYADGPSADRLASVVVKNCTFKSTKGAKAGAIANQNCAAIEMHNWGCSIDLTVEGNTYDSNFSGEWRIKTFNDNGYSVTVNGANYTTIAIDGKTMTIDSNKNVTVNN